MTLVCGFKFQAKSNITCMFLRDSIDKGPVPGPLPAHDPTRHTFHTIERYKYITASAKLTADPERDTPSVTTSPKNRCMKWSFFPLLPGLKTSTKWLLVKLSKAGRIRMSRTVQ